MSHPVPKSRSAEPKPGVSVRLARIVYAACVVTIAGVIFLGSFI